MTELTFFAELCIGVLKIGAATTGFSVTLVSQVREVPLMC
jgi:hypothetical protein